jgi:hypothetical protein
VDSKLAVISLAVIDLDVDESTAAVVEAIEVCGGSSGGSGGGGSKLVGG